MTRLSVNINKVATLRNARGGNVPDVQKVAIDCERFGAEGITVHPRPDERHIRYSDVYLLKKLVTTEFNIEGYPSEEFIKLVLEVQPEQVTLVPDPPDALTSNAGWRVKENIGFLKETIARFHEKNIRTSIFVETDIDNMFMAKESGTDRVELYTEPYAANFPKNPESAITDFVKAAEAANKVGLGLNAGHDLSLENLEYFVKNIPGLLEVSIGHALISDALYFGLENTIQMYRRKISNT
ncbi:MAG: pyridoxine 5'-phosphate synthase [Marinilabiliales bacterium]|nr:MAG: pyridoxine 5'-phosphate synthase [Marinilabiliales bacterium]